MHELFVMISIINRRQIKRFREVFDQAGASLGLVALGRGTARSEILDYFGLAAMEKAILCSVVTAETWQTIKADLQKKLYIDVPGTGISFIIPMSSIGGKKQMQFLLNGQTYEKKEETTLKDTQNELLVIIANQGYTEQVMEVVRAHGAGGGTVLHAKGTGMQASQHFLGVSLAVEKETILTVVPQSRKNEIMSAIMEHAGLKTAAQAIVFSLPVTATAGMRLTQPDAE